VSHIFVILINPQSVSQALLHGSQPHKNMRGEQVG